MISNFPTFNCTDNDIADHNDATADDGGEVMAKNAFSMSNFSTIISCDTRNCHTGS